MMRCIYVDDEEALLEISKEFLELEGDISVDTASSVENALKLLSKATYDAIISDYQMPGTDGIQFLKRIRSEGMDIPFILFTGRGREEVVIEALKSGADHYIKKGGEPRAQYAELANLVRQTVRRKQAEEAIHYNDIRFRALVESTRDLVTIIDHAGRIVYTSPSTRGVLGFELEDVEGRLVFDYIHPDDRFIEEIIRSSNNGGDGGLPLEFRLLAKDGGYRWFRASAKGYVSSKGQHQIILYAWYIDDRKKAEDDLLARDSAYHSIMENLEEMVFILDEAGRFLMVNKTLCDFFGRSRESLLGMSASELATPERRDAIISVVVSKLNGEPSKTTHTTEIIDCHGRAVKVNVAISILTTNGLKRILGVAIPADRCSRTDNRPM
jgi:PAS domain S-box-containing protein